MMPEKNVVARIKTALLVLKPSCVIIEDPDDHCRDNPPCGGCSHCQIAQALYYGYEVVRFDDGTVGILTE